MWSKTNEAWREGATPHLRMGPTLNGRSPHLIEAAKRGRLDQMIFFSAPLTTRAPPTTVRPDVCPDVRRPSGRKPGRSREKTAPATIKNAEYTRMWHDCQAQMLLLLL